MIASPLRQRRFGALYPVGHAMNPGVVLAPAGKTQAPIHAGEPHPKWIAARAPSPKPLKGRPPC